MPDPNVFPDICWTSDLRDACAERCAEFGDPPCQDAKPLCGPCDPCLRACGFETAALPPDPAAVVAPLL